MTKALKLNQYLIGANLIIYIMFDFTQQKDQNAKKRAKKRNHLNSEEVQNHQIIHSAFQSAFGDKDSVVVNSVDSSNQPDSRREKTDTRNDRHELRGSKQESKSERREPGHDREKPGRKKHDRRGARNSLTLNRHRRNVADVFPTIDRSDPIAHLVRMIFIKVEEVNEN